MCVCYPIDNISDIIFLYVGGGLTDVKKTLVDSGKKTIYHWDDKHKEYYSILKPKRGVKDVNVRSIIESCANQLIKYKSPVEDKFYDKMKYECKEDQFEDFFKCLEKGAKIISNNELDITFGWEIRPAKQHNIWKIDTKTGSFKNDYKEEYPFDENNPYYLTGEAKSFNIVNNLKNKLKERPGFIKNITMRIQFHDVKGRIYEYWNR